MGRSISCPSIGDLNRRVSGRMIGNTFLGVLLGCTSPQLAFFMIFDDFAALLNERERGPEKREKYVGYETDFFIFFSYII